MEPPKVLTGEELVSRGVTTIFATLPEIGLKEVTPNGSWLEVKQIQAALEARKNLIEVERIEKFGTLSQAEWRDDLKLAEVTKHTGSHWQFFGHNVGKKMYLRSEEVLFLMEVNCLQLKHNEVTVSLQKAYSLVLDDEFTINLYKVYSSLSRVGYKVYRHKCVRERNVSDPNTETKLNILKMEIDTLRESLTSTSNGVVDETKDVKTIRTEEAQPNNNIDGDYTNSLDQGETSNNEGAQIMKNDLNEVSSTITDESLDDPIGNNAQNNTQFQNNNSGEQNSVKNEAVEDIDVSQENENLNATNSMDIDNNMCYAKMKIEYLRSRELRPAKDIHKVFEEVPEMANETFAYVNTPEDYYIPKNIFVNKTTYKLNLDRIKGNKEDTSSGEEEEEEEIYSTSEDEETSLRSIRNTSSNEPPQQLPPIRNLTPYYPQIRLPRVTPQFPPFMFWRARPHFNLNMNFNSFFPRPFMHHQFHHRFPLNVRPNPILRPSSHVNVLANNDNDNSIRLLQKRAKKSKVDHFRSVKMLSSRVKACIMSGQMHGQSQANAIQALHELLYTYNTKYRTNLRLTSRFDVVEDTTPIQTIELDDDEEVKRKKPKLANDTFNDNLKNLRELAQKLKSLGSKGITTSRHRRAFSNAVKMFNTSYKADVYLDDNYEIIDRRHITLDSSSDNEGTVATNSTGASNGAVATNHKVKSNRKSRKTKKRKLRNPFYILKKLSEQQIDIANIASTSRSNVGDNNDSRDSDVNTKPIKHTKWMPKDDDFGKRELCTKDTCMLKTIDTFEEGLLFQFLANHPGPYDSWIDIKIAFLKHANEIHKQYLAHQSEIQTIANESRAGLRPIIRADDYSGMPTILEKLRIIKTNKDYKTESCIKIHFDVYQRDVANFRKSNPPKPHFRVVCLDDSSQLPSGEDLASLNAIYNDGVDVVFAIVGVGSISYLQINPVEIPVYMPAKDGP